MRGRLEVIRDWAGLEKHCGPDLTKALDKFIRSKLGGQLDVRKPNRSRMARGDKPLPLIAHMAIRNQKLADIKYSAFEAAYHVKDSKGKVLRTVYWNRRKMKEMLPKLAEAGLVLCGTGQ